MGTPLAVLTFARNPKPGREKQSLTPLKSKKNLLESLRVDYLIVVQFNEQVKSLTPAQFLNYLYAMGAGQIVCGPDFTFGSVG